MDVALFSYSLDEGGAALACSRFFALAQRFSRARCVTVTPGTYFNVSHPERVERAFHFGLRLLEHGLLQSMRTTNKSKHSLNLISSRKVLAELKKAAAAEDVVNVHWIGNGTLSVFDMRYLPAGAVITMHDEWIYCGAEHYRSIAGGDNRYIDGYKRRNKNVCGVDWNRYIWKLKSRYLGGRKDLVYTVPSRWMLDRTRESFLLHDKDVRLLPNPVDTQVFRPLTDCERDLCRVNYGFGERDIVIAFGAVNGSKNPIKGAFFLEEALFRLREMIPSDLAAAIKVLTFGGHVSNTLGEIGGFPARNLGPILSEAGMRRVYGAADLSVVPSLVESFGQVAAESLACGTPVVSFATSGLLDIIHPGISGLVAKTGDSEELANCIASMVCAGREKRRSLGENGRKRIQENFSPNVVARAYESILNDAVALRRRALSA